MNAKEEIRETLINTACNVFSKFGFKKTTMDEIADASRKGKSSLYYYFKSKEEIFKAVVEKEALILKGKILAGIYKSEDPKEKLKAYILIRLEEIRNLANYYNALKNDYLSNLNFISKIRVKHNNQEIEIVKSILQLGIDSGEFDIKDVNLDASVVVTVMEAFEIKYFIDNQFNEGYKDKLDDIMNVIFYGLVKR